MPRQPAPILDRPELLPERKTPAFALLIALLAARIALFTLIRP